MALSFSLVGGHLKFDPSHTARDKKSFALPNSDVVVSVDLLNWLLSVFIAGNIIYYLQQLNSFINTYPVSICAILAIVRMTNSGHRTLVLPQIPGQFATFFWTLLMFSLLPVYHSGEGVHLRTYLEDVLVFVQAGSQAIRERHNSHGPLGSELPLAESSPSLPPASVHPEQIDDATDRNQPMEAPDSPTGAVYRPLLDDQIRMLRFVSEEGDSPYDMRLVLSYHSFSEFDGQYSAVSYCWGKKGLEKEEIIIDGERVFVSARLYEILLEIRNVCPGSIWIDALCINQTDLVERSGHVLRMKAIYGRAREVIACLSPEDDLDDHCLQMMSFLKSIPDDRVRNLDFPASGTASFDDLKAFVKRPYWRRVWIIQELAAARKVSLIARGERVSLDKFAALLAHVDKQPPRFTEWPSFNLDLQLVKRILDIRAQRINDKPLRLLQTLVYTQRSGSTIPHDKVFGLLSLTTDGQDFMAEPDYRLSETELCKRMTRSFIESRQNLDIILAGSRNLEDSGLPSWCPDYLSIANTPLNHDFVRYLSGEDKCHRLGVEGTIWETTGGRGGEPRVVVEFRDDQLGLRGLRIGTIGGLGATGRQSTSAETDEYRFVLTKQDTGFTKSKHDKRRPSEPKRGYSTYDGLCRMLLIYDSHYAEFTKSPIVLGMLYNLAYLAYAGTFGGHKADIVWMWLKKNRNLFIHGKTLRDRAFYSWDRVSHNYLGGFFKMDAKTMTILHYRHITDSVSRIITQNLRLMSTSEGEVGWVHPTAMLDDEIFLFQGCSLPVVLRPVSPDPRTASGTKLSDPGLGLGALRQRPSNASAPFGAPATVPVYRVVGHAFVDGYMDGKRWASTEPSKLMEITVI